MLYTTSRGIWTNVANLRSWSGHYEFTNGLTQSSLICVMLADPPTPLYASADTLQDFCNNSQVKEIVREFTQSCVVGLLVACGFDKGQ